MVVISIADNGELIRGLIGIGVGFPESMMDNWDVIGGGPSIVQRLAHLLDEMELTFRRPDDVSKLSGDDRAGLVRENADLSIEAP